MANHFSIQPVTYADINALTKISGDSFEMDRHTQMKGLGKVPYVLEDVGKSDLARYLASEKCVCMKAVNDVTGEAMGWSAWGFRGFEKGEVPRLEPGENLESMDTPVFKDEKPEEEMKKADEAPEDKGDDDIIRRLEAMTDADMKHWMETLMPEGTKCMFVVTLAVAPKFQSQGVGSALLKWGTDTADKFGVFAWVHSSEAAWKTYEKVGFEVVGTLDVDLDAWAPAPPPKEEGEGAIWGHYVFRYMKRLPKN